MTETETAFSLLQVVALLLPAVAIYLQILSSRHDLSDMDAGNAANYHAIRLTFVYLLFSALLLIFAILIFPQWKPIVSFLNGLSLLLLGSALATLALPVIFSKIGLSDSRSLFWPYKNTWHRISDAFESDE